MLKYVFFFKQKTAYEMLISDWSSDVCSSDLRTQKNEALLRRFGQFVDELGGTFIASLDIGTTPKDMEFIRMETEYVAGLPKSLGGSGDSAPFTAKRSEARRVGKACVSPCSSRWSPYH